MEGLDKDVDAGRAFRAMLADDDRLRRTEADHRIANSLQMAAAALMSERRRLTLGDAARDALDAASSRLSASARLHRSMARPAGSGEVGMADYLADLRDDLAHSVGGTLRVDAGEVALPAQSAEYVGIVVVEMMTNAVKHHARDGRAPVLTVEIDRSGAGDTRLRIHDDGPGFPEGFDLDGTDSIGLSIVRSAVGRLGGTMRLLPRFGPYLEVGAGLEIVLPPQGTHDA